MEGRGGACRWCGGRSGLRAPAPPRRADRPRRSKTVELACGDGAEQLADHRRDQLGARQQVDRARSRSPPSSRAGAPRSRPRAARARRSRRRPSARAAPATPSSCVEGLAAAHVEDGVDPLAAVGLADRGAEVLGARSRRWRRRRAARPAPASPRSRRARSPCAPARLASCTARRAGAAGGGLDHDVSPCSSRAQRSTSASAVRPCRSSAAAWSSSTSSGTGTRVASGTATFSRVAAAAEQRRDAAAVGGAAADLGAGDQRQLPARPGSRCGWRGCRRS